MPTTTQQAPVVLCFGSVRTVLIKSCSERVDELIPLLLHNHFAYAVDTSCGRGDKTRIEQTIAYLKSKRTPEMRLFYAQVKPSIQDINYSNWNIQSSKLCTELLVHVKAIFEGSRVSNATINSFHRLNNKEKK